jgi:hypothetical protein
MVSGTNELMSYRDDFKKGFEALRPLGMIEVKAKAKEFMNKAVQLQRALNRTRESCPKPLDSKYASLDENIDAIMDWFALEDNALPTLFERYLNDT